jgi:hypothetical protein
MKFLLEILVFQTFFKNFSFVQQSLQFQTMMVMQQNPQLAPLILSQVCMNSVTFPLNRKEAVFS